MFCCSCPSLTLSAKTIDSRIKLGSEYILHVVSYNLLENFTILSVYELSLSVNYNFLVTSYGGVKSEFFDDGGVKSKFSDDGGVKSEFFVDGGIKSEFLMVA